MNKSQQYYAHLDSLRGIAAFMVCLYHVNWANHLTTNFFVKASDLFVDFFFVLSGFVICHVYHGIRTRTDVTDFLRKRFARLYPLHFLTLMLHAAAFYLVAIYMPSQWARLASLPQMQNLGSRFVAHLFLLNAHGLTTADSYNIPSWSIGAETTCYMLFAVILLWFFKAKNKIFVVFVFCSLLALILVGGRMVALQSKFGVLRGMYGFFIGCLIYSLYRARPQLLAKLNATAGVLPVSFCVAGLFALMWFIHALPLWVFYVFPPVFGVMLFLLIEPTRPILRFLQSPPLLMLGTLSYSIYMINFPVKLAVGLVLVRMGATYEHSEDIVISPWAGDLLVLCFVAAVLALSWLSYYYYEHPMRLLLGSKRRRAQSTEPGPVRQAL